MALARVQCAVAAGRLPPRDLGPSLLPLHGRAEPPTGLACRLRLAGVYAFRPRWHDLARRWYDAALADGVDAGSQA